MDPMLHWHTDLSEKGLKSVPEWVWDRQSLVVLSLAHNLIEELPREVEGLGHVRELRLRGNR